ncbi:MAG: RNA-directed DNA polymerase [Candidatus Omnitrophica bacterium]|nr:RNA-directed DNA polymerase [Candidatus Omnitrophota bacterium]
MEPNSEDIFANLKLGEAPATEEQKCLFVAKLREFEDIFSKFDGDLGRSTIVEHSVNVEGAKPIKQRPYRIPFSQRAVVQKLVDNMEKTGVIEKSCSPWQSPILVVPKKDGTSRFCIDFRKVNAVTKADSFPLPRIDELLDCLGSNHCSHFSLIDLAAGYWNIGMEEKSKEITAFALPQGGLYHFNVMPFGLKNAPSTFQRCLETALSGLIWKSCFLYIDDILVIGRTFEEHLENFEKVLIRLRQANLKIKLKKCNFLCKSILYLGHVVSAEGISVDPSKTEKVQNFPPPTNISALNDF